MKAKPDGDDMGTSIARTILGYGCLIAAAAVGVILLIAALSVPHFVKP